MSCFNPRVNSRDPLIPAFSPDNIPSFSNTGHRLRGGDSDPRWVTRGCIQGDTQECTTIQCTEWGCTRCTDRHSIITTSPTQNNCNEPRPRNGSIPRGRVGLPHSRLRRGPKHPEPPNHQRPSHRQPRHRRPNNHHRRRQLRSPHLLHNSLRLLKTGRPIPRLRWHPRPAPRVRHQVPHRDNSPSNTQGTRLITQPCDTPCTA